MGSISLPPVPYAATAERPRWSSLPAELRAAIGERLGAPVVGVTHAGGGFTEGFAAVLRTVGDGRVFVKAARLDDQEHLADWYAHEAMVTELLPAAVPAARPRWTLTTAGYFVSCLDAIDGHIPAMPWKPAELTAALRAWATAHRALHELPTGLLTMGLPRLTDLLRQDLSYWQWIAAGQAPMPPAAEWAVGQLPELAALEAALPGYVDTPTLAHGDLRLDNILIDTAGAGWLCDWNWVCWGAPWFDTATLLVTAYASGLDADTLFATHSTAVNCPSDGLDAALAALSGYWLSRAASASTSGSPHLRAHQRWSGETALSWLASRRHWQPHLD